MVSCICLSKPTKNVCFNCWILSVLWMWPSLWSEVEVKFRSSFHCKSLVIHPHNPVVSNLIPQTQSDTTIVTIPRRIVTTRLRAANHGPRVVPPWLRWMASESWPVVAHKIWIWMARHYSELYQLLIVNLVNHLP